MVYQLSPGHRVTWCHDFTETKAQITRVWKNKAEIVTADFEKIRVPLEELELVPVVIKEVVREPENCTLTDDEISVREQPENDCTLTDETQSVRVQAIATLLPNTCTLTNQENLHPNSWIEEKMIRRSGKLHGPYRYERWRDETGKMKSKYLGKKR